MLLEKLRQFLVFTMKPQGIQKAKFVVSLSEAQILVKEHFIGAGSESDILSEF